MIIVGIAAYLLVNSGSCTVCGTPVGSSYLQQMQRVAVNYSLASSVGSGIASNLPKNINAAPLTSGGRPEILYVGGDFCPYCAVTRWGLVLALMRFGNFTSLSYMESSATDSFADTPTFSFVNSSYHSSLINFDGFEIYDRATANQTTNITQSELNIYYSYSQGVPFIDFANSSVQSGALVNPQLLDGSNWNQILNQMQNPDSTISQAVIGQANVFTAAICRSDSTLNSTAVACRQNYLKSIPS